MSRSLIESGKIPTENKIHMKEFEKKEKNHSSSQPNQIILHHPTTLPMNDPSNNIDLLSLKEANKDFLTSIQKMWSQEELKKRNFQINFMKKMGFLKEMTKTFLEIMID